MAHARCETKFWRVSCFTAAPIQCPKIFEVKAFCIPLLPFCSEFLFCLCLPEGVTPLTVAVKTACLPIIKQLLHAKASVDSQDDKGHTAIRAAVVLGKWFLFCFLHHSRFMGWGGLFCLFL